MKKLVEFEELIKQLDNPELEKNLRNAWSIIPKRHRDKLLTKGWDIASSLHDWYDFVISLAQQIIQQETGQSAVWALGADDFKERFKDLIQKAEREI